MTANYFMVTKDGIGLSADYLPFARGSAAATTTVTDKVRLPARQNLLANGSFESNLAGWTVANGSQARSSAQAAKGTYSNLLTKNSNGTHLFLSSDQMSVPGPGLDYAIEFQTRPGGAARDVSVVIYKYDSSGASLGGTEYALGTQSAGTWTSHATVFTVTASTARVYAEINIKNPATGEQHYVDATTIEVAQAPTITGVPADLAGYDGLFKAKGYIVESPDVIAPTGFTQSVFRVVRDPAIATDDSGLTLGNQIYNHGWVLGRAFVSYLSENPAYGGRPVAWPADGGYKILPVTGTPVVNDGAGTYGMQSVTWPGSSVGVGTLRQVVSGDEGTGRKVAAILDLLASLGDVERSTIASTYTNTSVKASIDAARPNLRAAVSAASEAARNQFSGRASLAWFLACQAVAASRAPWLENALQDGMQAIVAKEAGLVGSTFTTANYESMTTPLDNVLDMPSGY